MITLRQLLKIKLESAFKRRGAQADFLRRSGIGAPTIHHWLKGERAADLDQVEIIAETLGIQPWELLRADDANPTPKEPTLAEIVQRLDRIEKLLQRE